MNLTPAMVAKLEAFFSDIEKTTYPEPESALHNDLTAQVFPLFLKHGAPVQGGKVLDVGCGKGVALELFKAHGFVPLGVTLSQDDVDACKAKGFNASKMDQSFLDFDDQSFDVLWVRHCLEHSVMPLFTLREFYRVLKPQGLLYVEVPAPDTSANHQRNPNHYSVLGKDMWLELIMRAGFAPICDFDVAFNAHYGDDVYWSFIQSRPAADAPLK